MRARGKRCCKRKNSLGREHFVVFGVKEIRGSCRLGESTSDQGLYWQCFSVVDEDVWVLYSLLYLVRFFIACGVFYSCLYFHACDVLQCATRPTALLRSGMCGQGRGGGLKQTKHIRAKTRRSPFEKHRRVTQPASLYICEFVCVQCKNFSSIWSLYTCNTTCID